MTGMVFGQPFRMRSESIIPKSVNVFMGGAGVIRKSGCLLCGTLHGCWRADLVRLIASGVTSTMPFTAASGVHSRRPYAPYLLALSKKTIPRSTAIDKDGLHADV